MSEVFEQSMYNKEADLNLLKESVTPYVIGLQNTFTLKLLSQPLLFTNEPP